MLIYHPAYDSYHCITRILKLLTNLRLEEYRIDRIRIYDYYILFTNDIYKLTLPHDFSDYKNIVKTNKYNRIDDSKYVFNQLSAVQTIAFRAIASFGFIDKDLFDKGVIKLSDIEIPKDLVPNVKDYEIKYFSLINNYFETISLRELKERTKIMEYRYELS